MRRSIHKFLTQVAPQYNRWPIVLGQLPGDSGNPAFTNYYLYTIRLTRYSFAAFRVKRIMSVSRTFSDFSLAQARYCPLASFNHRQLSTNDATTPISYYIRYHVSRITTLRLLCTLRASANNNNYGVTS